MYDYEDEEEDIFGTPPAVSSSVPSIDFEKELNFLLSDKMFNSKISQLTEIADSPFYSKTVLDFKEHSKAKIEFLEFSNEFIERAGL